MSDLHLQSQYELTLDAKQRLTVPARAREPFKAGLVLVRSHDVPAIGVEPVASYQRFVEEALAGAPPLDQRARMVERYLNSMATPVELDGQGRVTLPATLRRHAAIDGREVLLVGSGRRFEVWSPERWEGYAPSMDEAMRELGAQIAGLAEPPGGAGGWAGMPAWSPPAPGAPRPPAPGAEDGDDRDAPDADGDGS